MLYYSCITAVCTRREEGAIFFFPLETDLPRNKLDVLKGVVGFPPARACVCVYAGAHTEMLVLAVHNIPLPPPCFRHLGTNERHTFRTVFFFFDCSSRCLYAYVDIYIYMNMFMICFFYDLGTAILLFVTRCSSAALNGCEQWHGVGTARWRWPSTVRTRAPRSTSRTGRAR